MAAKLKVFVTSDGLTEYAVAASSRPKALAAWGVRQDLFAQGAARETDDPTLVEAAVARPGEVVERSVGGVKLPKAPRKPVKRGPSKAAVRKVEELEAGLKALDEAHGARLAEIAEAQARETAAYDAERGKLSGRLSKARAALKG